MVRIRAQSEDMSRTAYRGDSEEPSATPYLNIRCDTADMGDASPSHPLDPGRVFWASPDIFVSPTDSFGNVPVGVNATVHANVFNWGAADATPVNVEFYWVNPALGITPANGNLIGSTLVTVQAGLFVDVTCPKTWTPSFLNGGHECLIVQCSCPGDPILAPFSPVLDRHVGQRNITVTQPQQVQKLQLSSSNPFGLKQSFMLHLSSRLVRCRLEKWDKDAATLTSLLASLHSPGRTLTEAEGRLELQVQDVTGKDWGVRLVNQAESKVPRIDRIDEQRLDFGQYTRQRATRNPDFRPDTLGKVLSNFSLTPRLMNIVDVEIPPVELKQGEFVVHSLTQTAGGYDVGGYTVIVPPGGKQLLKR